MSSRAFAALGLDPLLADAAERAGYRSPTPIQKRTIPVLLSGRDLIGIAQTGTGKTAAFALPLLQRLAAGQPGPVLPRALVLAPTRELALQIGTEMRGFGTQLDLSLAVIFGGVASGPQIRALQTGIDIVVGTPGRLLDLVGQRQLDLGGIRMLVLDEADRLLDLGFHDDLQRIVRATPADRQSVLFSATLAAPIEKLAASLLRRPARIDVTPGNVTVDRIRQRVIRVEKGEKFWVLEHLLRESPRGQSLVFCRSRNDVDRIRADLARAGVPAAALHGDLSQHERLQALEAFRLGEVRVLVATDVAARGLDIPEVAQVINYQMPHDPQSYVHRIGRTGRAGEAGMAWTLCDSSEVSRLRMIERFIGRPIPTEAEAAAGDSGAARRMRKTPAKRRQGVGTGARARGRATARDGTPGKKNGPR